MDEIFNRMQHGPPPAEPAGVITTLSEKLSKSEQEVQELRRKIRILEESQNAEESPADRQKEIDNLRRLQRLQLLHAQMYGEEDQLFEGYGGLGAGANNDQQPHDIGPEEFLNIEEFLLEGEPGLLVQQDHLNTLYPMNNTAWPDLKDMEASNRCEACGTERVCEGAANFDDSTCPKCDQLNANNLHLGGIGIPMPGRGEQHMHRMHRYGSDPIQVNSSSFRGDSLRSSPEHCSFCDGVLSPGSVQSHLSSCPEYHRWSGTGSNDSFFYHSRRSLKKSTSAQLIHAKFPAE